MEMTCGYRLRIKVEDSPRGNTHGYTSSDYAHDAARDIDMEFEEQFAWPDDKHESLARSSAINIAEQAISKVAIGGERLSYEISKCDSVGID